jgi:hypothetical protein
MASAYVDECYEARIRRLGWSELRKLVRVISKQMQHEPQVHDIHGPGDKTQTQRWFLHEAGDEVRVAVMKSQAFWAQAFAWREKLRLGRQAARTRTVAALYFAPLSFLLPY